jgi:hypothetical protein
VRTADRNVNQWSQVIRIWSWGCCVWVYLRGVCLAGNRVQTTMLVKVWYCVKGHLFHASGRICVQATKLRQHKWMKNKARGSLHNSSKMSSRGARLVTAEADYACKGQLILWNFWKNMH